MKEKEKSIIEAAIPLFAKKGFTNTSIQEIVNEAGISKGAFYLYYKSKESLLMAIFRHCFEEIERKVKAIESYGFSPRDQFIRQLTVYCREVLRHKDFIIMQARENALPFNEEVQEFILKMRTDKYTFYQLNLKAIYGDAAGSFLDDATVLLKGMVDGYLEFVLFGEEPFDLDGWADFLLRRMDSIVAGFDHAKEKPVITEEYLAKISQGMLKAEGTGGIAGHLEQLEKLISGTPKPLAYQETYGILTGELESASPRKAIIKGMLLALREIDGANNAISGIARHAGIDF